jgi:hypothetical protein
LEDVWAEMVAALDKADKVYWAGEFAESLAHGDLRRILALVQSEGE